MYSYKTESKNNKTAKGVQKNIIKRDIDHSDYLTCLQNNTIVQHKMKTIRSEYHDISSYEINKTSLSCYDDKRYILDDGKTSYAYGHCRLCARHFLSEIFCASACLCSCPLFIDNFSAYATFSVSWNFLCIRWNVLCVCCRRFSVHRLALSWCRHFLYYCIRFRVQFGINLPDWVNFSESWNCTSRFDKCNFSVLKNSQVQINFKLNAIKPYDYLL